WSASTQIVHIVGLLNSTDPAVRHLVREEISTLVEARYNKPLSNDTVDFPVGLCTDQQVLAYMSGQYEHLKKGRYVDAVDPSAGIVAAIKHVGCRFVLTEADPHLPDSFVQFAIDEDTIVANALTTPRRKTTMIGRIKRFCQSKLLARWQTQVKQGQSVSSIQHPASNAWIRTDDLHPGAYAFALKSRLDMLPTNANKVKWGFGQTRNCHSCSLPEDIHHVLCFCRNNQSKTLQTERHNKVLQRIVSAARYNNRSCTISVNQRPPLLPSQSVRPDLVVVDEEKKTVFITDVVITAQSSSQSTDATSCLTRARQRKLDKYKSVKDAYEAMGFSVTMSAFAFGDVGGTDEENFSQLLMLKCKRGYAERLHRWLICDILRFGHRLWIQRCRGVYPAGPVYSSTDIDARQQSQPQNSSPTGSTQPLPATPVPSSPSAPAPLPSPVPVAASTFTSHCAPTHRPRRSAPPSSSPQNEIGHHSDTSSGQGSRLRRRQGRRAASQPA
ncbi:hypothetical protein INT47_000366, partial [Mucor saturninus]